LTEKYVGPDVVVGLLEQNPRLCKNRKLQLRIALKKVFGWFHGQKDLSVNAVSIDLRAQSFTYHIDHMVN
jgi:hypothetical protein